MGKYGAGEYQPEVEIMLTCQHDSLAMLFNAQIVHISSPQAPCSLCETWSPGLIPGSLRLISPGTEVLALAAYWQSDIRARAQSFLPAQPLATHHSQEIGGNLP